MPTVHETRYRLLYRDTDPMRVLYYGRYMELFEMGRTEFCRAEDFSYAGMENELGLGMPVTEAWVRYRQPIYFDEVAIVRTRIIAWTFATVRWAYEIHVEGREGLCAHGETELAIIQLADGRPTRFPEALQEVFRRVAPDGHGRIRGHG